MATVSGSNLAGDVLIVEDTRLVTTMCEKYLTKRDYRVRIAKTGEEALAAVQESSPAIILLDLGLPDAHGLDLLPEIKAMDETIEVVVMTARGTVENAVAAMRNGACDFITKPIEFDGLERSLAIAGRQHELRSENRRLRSLVDDGAGLESLVGESPAMQQLKRLLRKVGPTEEVVLIGGENGTGKEVVARSLHACSQRAQGPFIAINCGAIADSLVESELFGHVKGAFSGADRNRLGLFRQAEGGTLFLDEIGEMPMAMQVKLLRALENREVTPVGADRPIPVDCRIVAATNRQLPEEVSAGRFREDLYYRLNIFAVHLPALRERISDIPLLAQRFLDDAADDGEHLRLDPTSATLLERWSWPGNVRELQNAMRRATILSEGVVLPEHLPPRLVEGQGLPTPAVVAPAAGTPPVAPEPMSEPIGADAPPVEATVETAPPEPPTGPAEAAPAMTTAVFTGTLEELEKRAIFQALENNDGDRARTAQALGIDRTTLYRKLKRYEAADDSDGSA